MGNVASIARDKGVPSFRLFFSRLLFVDKQGTMVPDTGRLRYTALFAFFLVYCFLSVIVSANLFRVNVNVANDNLLIHYQDCIRLQAAWSCSHTRNFFSL